ncbi:hypothetical protein ACVWXN_010838 [Bradyrhizobium sp. i1.4.4]
MTAKILAPTDALGNLVRFVLLPGQRFDTVGVPPLIAIEGASGPMFLFHPDCRAAACAFHKVRGGALFSVGPERAAVSDVTTLQVQRDSTLTLQKFRSL